MPRVEPMGKSFEGAMTRASRAPHLIAADMQGGTLSVRAKDMPYKFTMSLFRFPNGPRSDPTQRRPHSSQSFAHLVRQRILISVLDPTLLQGEIQARRRKDICHPVAFAPKAL